MRRRSLRQRSRGVVLVEFALVSLVLYLVLAAVLTFGSMLWIGQTLQQAVDVAAQEIAREPFCAEAGLGLGDIERDFVDPCCQVADTPIFRARLYDERFLVVRPSELARADGSERSLLEYADEEMPLLNRLLVPAMIFDRTYDPEGTGGVWRFPGAVVVNPEGEETVLVPLVDGDAGAVTWIAPVEEIRVDPDGDGLAFGPFAVPGPPADQVGAGFVAGTVALRINYPFQAAAMSGFRGSPEGPFEPNVGLVLSADDGRIDDGDPGRYTLAAPANAYLDGAPSIHGGRYGLGRQIALPFDRDGIRDAGVRPYRRVISVQAIYRREVFDACTTPTGDPCDCDGTTGGSP